MNGSSDSSRSRRRIEALRKFPDQNPHPVLRMAADGRLEYANESAAPIVAAWRTPVGQVLGRRVVTDIRAAAADTPPGRLEVEHGGRTYAVLAVEVPELGVHNLYGTDITAQKALDKFPNQNPNPVLRLTRAGVLTYANPASAPVRQALGAEVGDTLDEKLFARISRACDDPLDPTLEVEANEKVFRLRVVSVYEFDSINVYGTDITAARQVERLNAENEALLLNILPRSIADRLRSGETVIADRFDDMAVLFADVVGFTQLSAELTPSEVVALLNDVFTACDHLAERFGLEKIKTVGDAYMVVGGFHFGDHGHSQTHAADVADMGLAMLDEVERLGKARDMPLSIRVGMHVGPAVAGVIGIRKFIYDVWGDTVNTASRMESTGVPGRFQVTVEAHDRLADRFAFEPRGPIEVKGKGVIETWFLTGRR